MKDFNVIAAKKDWEKSDKAKAIKEIIKPMQEQCEEAIEIFQKGDGPTSL